MTPIQELLSLLQNKGPDTQQDPRYHPEGNVYVHSLLTFWGAVLAGANTDLVLAALFHDIGKVGRDYKQQHGHAAVSKTIVTGILNENVVYLISNHMRVGRYLRGETKRINKRLSLEMHPLFEDLKKLYMYDQEARPTYVSNELLAHASRFAAYVCDAYSPL